MRFTALAVSALVALSACAMPAAQQPIPQNLGPDGKPLPRRYQIEPGSEGRIQYEMLDAVNVLRSAAGARPLQLNASLNAAAATHSRDMARQNRPWHFGSDGSSPLDRVRRAGYQGMLIGENISETYETELETLSAWMNDDPTRRVILDPRATDLGFAWYQEPNGKIWWTLIMGGGQAPFGLGA